MQSSLALLARASTALAKAIPRAVDERKIAVVAPGAAGNAEVSIQAIMHVYPCIDSDFAGACSNLEVQTGVCCESSRPLSCAAEKKDDRGGFETDMWAPASRQPRGQLQQRRFVAWPQ